MSINVILKELLGYNTVPKGTAHEELLFVAHCIHQYPRGFSQALQDTWVLYESGFKHNGFFVEFGAGDGFNSSNTQRLQKEFGWAGILCEPNTDYLPYLQMNSTNAVQICSGLVVAGESGKEVDFLIADDPSISSMYQIVGRDGNVINQNNNAGQIRKLQTLSLTDLLKQGNAPKHIDYISIDTEGTEFEIIENFRFDEYDVDMFTIEHNTDKEKIEKIHEFMTARGYTLRFPIHSSMDMWYLKNSLYERQVKTVGRSPYKKRTIKTITHTEVQEI